MSQGAAVASPRAEPNTAAASESASESEIRTKHKEKDPSPQSRGSPQAKDENGVLLFDFKSNKACDDPLVMSIAEEAELISPVRVLAKDISCLIDSASCGPGIVFESGRLALTWRHS